LAIFATLTADKKTVLYLPEELLTNDLTIYVKFVVELKMANYGGYIVTYL